MSGEIEKTGTVPAPIARGDLAQIQAALLRAYERISELDTPQAAEMWYSIDVIARDLAMMRRAASDRLCAIAPRETYRHRGEERTRPVKSQLVEGLGQVVIENPAKRTWADLRGMAHAMFDDWKQAYAKGHDGELPPPHVVINFIFNLFQVGDPRVTVMKDQGLGAYDKVDEAGDGAWVTKFYETKARVSP